MTPHRKKIICLMGPTSSGKTDLALTLSEHLPCDIVSVDSAMVYRDMNIGTAKPDKETLARYPHRLIDICDPAENYSAADFCDDATREIQAILKTDRIPLLVGGTMLYFRALQQGLSNLPSADPTIRAQLNARAAEQGIAALYAHLQAIDPVAASRIRPTDPQRIQRALEVYELTGKPLSELQGHAIAAPQDWQFINLALMPADRQALHAAISSRFHTMLEHGLIAEVKTLYERGDLNLDKPSMRAVGYRQVWQYLEGTISQAEMCETAIAATRQLAKRQMTWLRKWPAAHYFLPGKNLPPHLLDQVLPLLLR